MSISMTMGGTDRRTNPESAPIPAPTQAVSTPQDQFPRTGKLVHRTTQSDVLLSDWTRKETDRFALTLRWPDSHPFHASVHGRYAPSLVAESIRQAGRLIAHAEYGAPMNHHFLMRDLNYTIEPDHVAYTGPGSPPLLMDLTCSVVRLRGTQLARMTCHMVITRGGRTVATGYGSLTCTSPAAYRRLRGGRLDARPAGRMSPPLPPAEVLRTDPADVVLSPAGDPLRWLLRADPANPALFARPNDHVPGMVLMEAAHQCAHATAGPVGFYPTSMSLRFDRYAEFDAPCLIEARPQAADAAGRLSLEITGRQEGERVFLALVTGVTGVMGVMGVTGAMEVTGVTGVTGAAAVTLSA